LLLRLDIRNVIQIGLPRSIEEYSQQIGRAGRDDLPAKCALYVSPDDYIRRKNLEHRHFPSRDAIRRLVHDIFHVRCRGVEAGGILTVNQHDQVKKTAGRLDAWTAEYVYAALELRFGLMHQLSRREVPGQLRDDAISHLEQHGSNAKFRIRVPPLDVDVVRTADEIYAEMANRRNERIWRAAQIMQLVSGKRCVTRALAEHFDEVVVPGTTICRSCSVCVTAERRQERGRVAVAPPVIQGFDEREVASCSQMVARDEAAWGFSQVPVAEAESESEDEPDSCSTG
jgi:superfamily II DNA helicase RecQ